MKRTIFSALLMFSISVTALFAQGTISGSVTDADGKPLPGSKCNC